MSEKIFEYTLWFLAALLLMLPALIWRWHLRLRFLQNLVRINVLKRQQKSNHNLFFSTLILNSGTKLLYISRKREAETALRALIAGDTLPAAEFLLSKDEFMALLLQAHNDTATVFRRINRRKKIWLNNRKYGVFFPILAQAAGERSAMLAAVNKTALTVKQLDKEQAAYHNAVSAYAYLHEGDMLSASQNASAALKFFQKKQYAVETATCHLLLAQIYRISCVNDVAQTMIESAIAIYKTQKTPLFLARAVVAKGMLMVFENRLDEADELYQRALDMPITLQLKADIYNQTALLRLAQKKIKEAATFADKALLLQQKSKNKYGTAFALQLKAHAAFAAGKYRKTVEAAQQALPMYKKQDNYSAAAECLYLAAEAEYKMRHLTAAEENLREILQINRGHANSFHTANAYNLLGLIYLQKKDLQRAKVLFQQSLHLEQSNQRCEGLAADYANLALIDELCDYTENAAENLKIALEYAHQTGDEELISLIERRNTDR